MYDLSNMFDFSNTMIFLRDKSVGANLCRITNALETYVSMYKNAKDYEEKYNAFETLTRIINDLVLHNYNDFYNVLCKQNMDRLVKAYQESLDIVLDYYNAIFATMEHNVESREVSEEQKQEEIDYSKLTKAELIELLKNKK